MIAENIADWVILLARGLEIKYTVDEDYTHKNEYDIEGLV
jgi:hypothetical protein